MLDQQYCDALKELEAVKAERDALAAHVKRLTACANAVYVANNVGNVAGFDRLIEAVDEAPATSFTRLKAEWQAEAFWQFITDIEKTGWETAPALVVNALYTRCAELRRQAEEPAE